METKTILSEKFTLQARDFARGLIMSVLAAIVTFIYEFIKTESIFNIDYETVLKVAINAVVVYLFKNWVIEPPKVITVAKTNEDAKAAESIITEKING